MRKQRCLVTRKYPVGKKSFSNFRLYTFELTVLNSKNTYLIGQLLNKCNQQQCQDME